MNRQRLTNERQNPNKKRQKLDNSNYISIKDNWGPPPPTAPKKKKLEINETETDKECKKIRTEGTETLRNCKRIEDKVIVGEEIKGFEIEAERDWDIRLREHRERLEEETKERERRLERQSIKCKSWDLY